MRRPKPFAIETRRSRRQAPVGGLGKETIGAQISNPLKATRASAERLFGNFSVFVHRPRSNSEPLPIDIVGAPDRGSLSDGTHSGRILPDLTQQDFLQQSAQNRMKERSGRVEDTQAEHHDLRGPTHNASIEETSSNSNAVPLARTEQQKKVVLKIRRRSDKTANGGTVRQLPRGERWKARLPRVLQQDRCYGQKRKVVGSRSAKLQ